MTNKVVKRTWALDERHSQFGCVLSSPAVGPKADNRCGNGPGKGSDVNPMHMCFLEH